MKFFNKATKRVAQPPGTMAYFGEKKVDRVRIRFLDYEGERLEEREVDTVEDCFPLRDTPTVTWINIDGLHDTELMQKVSQHFGIHPLVMEDIVHTHQRPKLDEYDTCLFVVLKMLRFDEETERIDSEQFSLILGPNYVISFQERYGDVFEPVRERIRNGKGRFRRMGPDYLAYALLDAVVDNYFVILEKIGEKIEVIEEELLNNPTHEILHSIHGYKREMILLRRSVWPLREVVNTLDRADSALICEGIGVFLRDVYDHTIQVIDGVESFRDMLSGFQDLYLSSISHRMNEVMKVLTIMATIFIPLSFLAGVYGMNFEWIPELKWKWGYFTFWGIIVGAVAGMLGFFRHKRWI